MNISMYHLLLRFGFVFAATIVLLLGGAGVLHGLPKLGLRGRRVSDWLCRAPGLDGVVTYFTALPFLLGALIAGWMGLFAALLGGAASLLLWQVMHEATHRDAVQGPRIVKLLDRLVGRSRNHAALWVMFPVAPLFWGIRMTELVVYGSLVRLVRLPRYDQGEWVSLSRQKFAGLVGHDLIWCLYCDWMTGIWSLGTEMLRNIESFWCPIRFSDAKKCEHCRIDFPDVHREWIPADGTMQQVVDKMQTLYADGDHSWFGSRVGLTVNGRAVDDRSKISSAP